MTNPRLTQVMATIDAANLLDPNRELVDGQQLAKEWIYAQRMSQHLNSFYPHASELLQIACRAQHICRWKIPRSDYPMDKAGYKKWRTELAKFHGELTGELMQAQGYTEQDIERVKDLLLKRGLKRDEEVQVLEDVVCLVFIEFYLEDFASKHDEDKLLDIIRKTWNKMSDRGHQAALTLPLSSNMLHLVTKALS